MFNSEKMADCYLNNKIFKNLQKIFTNHWFILLKKLEVLVVFGYTHIGEVHRKESLLKWLVQKSRFSYQRYGGADGKNRH